MLHSGQFCVVTVSSFRHLRQCISYVGEIIKDCFNILSDRVCVCHNKQGTMSLKLDGHYNNRVLLLYYYRELLL